MEDLNMQDTELTILMPCLNEERTLGTCIKKAKKYLENFNVTGEILIADNGSTDNSILIAESAGAKVVRVKQKGYGSALRAGIAAARGKYIIMGDADDSYDFTSLDDYMKKLRQGNDLVMGNRFKGGIGKGAMPFLHKYLGNPVLSFIGRLFFNTDVRDFHCGLRGFNRQKMNSLNFTCTGMEFASEMVVKSVINDFSIIEVPTTLSKDGRDRPPHLNTWRDGWRHLRFLLIFSPKWLFLIPGFMSVILGIIFSSILIIHPITFDQVRLDIHTLLYAFAFILIGFQFISFFCFSKVFGVNNKLLQRDKWYDYSIKFFNLERGLITGLFFLLFGFAFTLMAYIQWSRTDFGDLNPQQMLRIVMPAVFSAIFGIQMIQNSFFISLLNINKETT